MDHGTRRLFVGALVILIAMVGLATVLLGGSDPGGPPPDTTSVDGVIVAVDNEGGLGDVRSFDLRTSEGVVRTFGLARLENGAGFPPGHLVEHSVTAEPVRVWFRTEGGVDEAIRLEDAGPSAS